MVSIIIITEPGPKCARRPHYTLLIRKEMIKDETGSIEIVLFNSLVDKVSNNTSYDFKKMRVQKFMNDRILKSTETTKVSKNDGVAIFVTDEELGAFSYEKTVMAKVVSLAQHILMYCLQRSCKY